jgi:hypothetical protein
VDCVEAIRRDAKASAADGVEKEGNFMEKNEKN